MTLNFYRLNSYAISLVSCAISRFRFNLVTISIFLAEYTLSLISLLGFYMSRGGGVEGLSACVVETELLCDRKQFTAGIGVAVRLHPRSPLALGARPLGPLPSPLTSNGGRRENPLRPVFLSSASVSSLTSRSPLSHCTLTVTL
jgi:hypothetical protein